MGQSGAAAAGCIHWLVKIIQCSAARVAHGFSQLLLAFVNLGVRAASLSRHFTVCTRRAANSAKRHGLFFS